MVRVSSNKRRCDPIRHEDGTVKAWLGLDIRVVTRHVLDKGTEVMFLKIRDSGDLIDVENINELVSPDARQVSGICQAGEDEKLTKAVSKQDLIFPSGEPLPQCWVNVDFRK